MSTMVVFLGGSRHPGLSVGLLHFLRLLQLRITDGDVTLAHVFFRDVRSAVVKHACRDGLIDGYHVPLLNDCR